MPDLEALKLRLVAMTETDMSKAEVERMSREISAIRLHLKRLSFEWQAMEERLREQGLRPD